MESEEFKSGGLAVKAVNILRLLSELEGSSQLCKYMGFEDDESTLNDIKKRYYKMYFRLKKQEDSMLDWSSIAQLVEQVTVNHPVPGSSPGGGVCLISSEVEHLVYTEAVGGSIPSSSIPIRRSMKNDYRKMQRMWNRTNKH